MINLSPFQHSIMQGKICAYCKKPTELTDSAFIYGMSYGPIYYCASCQAWVGCHWGTENALGRVANANLRYLKHKAHYYFDELWKSELLTRKEAYQWLCEELDIHPQYCHIGMFNEDTCLKVILLSIKTTYNAIIKPGPNFRILPHTLSADRDLR